MRSTAAVTVAAALVALSVPAGAAGGGDPIYKLGPEHFFHSGAWTEGTGPDKLRPSATGMINVGKGKDSIKPPSPGDSFVVVRGFIRLDRAGTYRFRPGYGSRAFNATTVRGKKIYRANADGAGPALAEA